MLTFFCALILSLGTQAQTNFLRFKSFGVGDAAYPQSPLIEASNGVLYGATTKGGIADGGTLFKLNKDGTGYQVLHRFGDRTDDGKTPLASLLEGRNGILYGTTSAGGASNAGTIFRLNKDGTSYAILWQFASGSDGSGPQANLIQGSDGILYGTTPFGGGSRAGTVFRINPDGNEYKVLYRFGTGSGGVFPIAPLVEGSDGLLYGTTFAGGTTDNFGLIFKLSKEGTGYSVMRRFTGQSANDGSAPRSGLVEGSDGALYGMTSQGGGADAGTVFKLNKDGSTYTVLRQFTGTEGDGGDPEGGLAMGRDEVLYGTTESGGTNDSGTVFKLKQDGTDYSVIYRFTDNDTSTAPATGVVEGSDGMLYGTTVFGGVNDSGTLFKLNKSGSPYQVLRKFVGSTSTDGDRPSPGLVEGSDGALYGTTLAGGTANNGTVFRVKNNGAEYSILHHFTGVQGDGIEARSALTEGNDGALYGTTDRGGSNQNGTIFKLNKDGSGYSVLHRFLGGNDGAEPFGALLEGSDGLLYGTTTGGLSSYGTIYKINKNGSGYVVVKKLTTPATDGSGPNAGLIQASDGFFYGTTPYGGSKGGGAIYRFGTNGAGYKLIRSFTGGDDGFTLLSPLLEGGDGMLYGTANFGGIGGWGTVFQLKKDGSGFVVLHSFDNTAGAGANPQGSLVQANDGTLYGTTSSGGTDNGGTLFKLATDGSGFAVLHSFNSTYRDGRNSQSGLLLATDGAFYGTTPYGGDSGRGTLFKLFGGPAPALTVEQIALRDNGVELVFSGSWGTPVRVETAEDLRNPAWVPLGSNIAIDVDGMAQFIDEAATNHPARFYRGFVQ